MSKTFVFLFLLFSISAVAAPVKNLVCENSHIKLGLSSASRELYVADKNIKNSEVIMAGNEHGRVSISFEANGEFNGGGEDGCTMISYMTVIAADGSIKLIETEDDTGAIVEFNCIEL